MTRMLRPSAVAALREHLHGPLVSPDDAEYNTARRVWNGRIDRRPALVAFCADEADVVAAVRFAREHGILVAVRVEVCWPKLALACASTSTWKATARPSSATPARWDSKASCRSARDSTLAGLVEDEKPRRVRR